MTRGLIDRETFDRQTPAAQENLLRQALLLCLTALELAGRDPDDWEAAAFTAALDHLAAKSLPQAYEAVERLLLPPSQRPKEPRAAGRRTTVLRVPAGAETAPASEKLDRNALRRRLLQMSAIQLPSLDRADARRSVVARARRRHAALATEGEKVD